MLERILIAGSGGQGIISVGKLLAYAATDALPHVTFFPAYGAEVRGGTSNCQVILSSDEIASPVAEWLDSMIIMNQQSARRFMKHLTADGLAVINTSMCHDIQHPHILNVKATEIADQLGSVRSANIVMMGAWIACRNILDPDVVAHKMNEAFTDAPAALRTMNMNAYRAGLKLGGTQ